LALAACTRTQEESSTETEGGPSPTSAGEEASSTTTEGPTVLGLAEDLGLQPRQCFASVPDLVASAEPTNTPLASDDQEAAATTVTVAPETTAAHTTTIPTPPIVAVADCGGTFAGLVYAVMCIGSLTEPGDLVDRPEDLGRLDCPGDPTLEWPGDRLLRRAAARICLEIFEQQYGQPYSESEILADEFVATRGVWELGDRRVVCTANE